MTTRHTSSAVSQRLEESNHFEITARTRHRLQKHHPNVFGRQFSRAIQRSVRFIALGGAEPNRQKNESPLISMKFGGILGLVCVSMYKKIWRKNLTEKVLFWQKTLKKCRFGPFFTYKST